MPITKSAKKALRNSVNKQVFNLRRLKAMRVAIKEVLKLAEAKKLAEAGKLLPRAYQAIDKATKRGVLKAGTAARRKSRLAKILAQSPSKK